MDAFVDQLQASSDLDIFLTSRVLEAVPYLFADDGASYVDWKTTLARGLDVDPHSIIVVGSAGAGVSLRPGNQFRAFNERSDVDVAVISSYYFEAAWRYVRSLGARRYRLPSDVQDEINNHLPTYVYWRAIQTDMILAHLPFGTAWTEALSQASAHPIVGGRSVNARLYRDIESLRSYQLRSINKARGQILTQPE